MQRTLDEIVAGLDALDAPDNELKPYPKSQAREELLIEGLHVLAARFGHEIAPTRIDGGGDMDFVIVGPEGVGPGRPCGRYGEELAALLSTVPRRTGVVATDSPALPVNGWCRINHFAVDRLLRNATASPDAAPGPR